jgi:hypothetical protein
MEDQMKEAYGVLGAGSAPRKVIEGSLNDIGFEPLFFVPWYGRPTSGLEVVYDWLIDNNVSFAVIAADGAKQVPKALATKATSVTYVDDVDAHIVKSLKEREVEGLALVLWDQDKEGYSVKVASMAIDLRLPTLELTNGLVPIILDGDQPIEEATQEELPDLGDASYERETLEMMPTALVKRMAKDKGFDPKSKQEAVDMLAPQDKVDVPIGSILIILSDGTELGFNGNPDLLKKIMDLVVESQPSW